MGLKTRSFNYPVRGELKRIKLKRMKKSEKSQCALWITIKRIGELLEFPKKKKGEVAENLLKEVVAENFLNLGRPLHRQVRKSKKKNLKSSKRQEACNLQGNPHKAISQLLSRNLTG